MVPRSRWPLRPSKRGTPASRRSVIAAIVNEFCNVDRERFCCAGRLSLAAPSPQIHIDLTVATAVGTATAMEATTAAMETTATAVETAASVVRTASIVRAARPVSTATAVARAGPIAWHRAASGVTAAVGRTRTISRHRRACAVRPAVAAAVGWRCPLVRWSAALETLRCPRSRLAEPVPAAGLSTIGTGTADSSIRACVPPESKAASRIHLAH